MPPPERGLRQMMLDQGPGKVAAWMKAEKRLLITDTTMRDGHQSLLATRMRSIDMVRVAPAYASNLPQLFSVECWGGATLTLLTGSCRNAHGSACASCELQCRTICCRCCCAVPMVSATQPIRTM